MNILLLGARGQLGSLVCAGAPGQLLMPVSVASGQLPRPPSGKPARLNLLALHSQQLDVRDADAVAQTCRQFQPDVVINAAAYTQVDRAESEPEQACAINRQGVVNLIAATSPATRLIHISTDFVFDGTGTTPYQPDAPVNPLGVYGASKLAGEQALLQQAAERSCIIRTAWLYADEGKNFLNTMLNLMATRDELNVVNDQRGTPTSAHRLAAAIWQFVARPELRGIFHWSDNGEATWHDFASEIQARALHHGLLERRVPIHPVTTTQFPTPAKRPAYSVLDKTSTWSALGVQGAAWQAELDKVLQIKKARLPKPNGDRPPLK